MLNIEKIALGYESEYKVELLEIISYDFDSKDLNDLIYYLDNDINDNGAIDQLIDNNIDIYYYYLRKWAVDNYEYIEQYHNEFGVSEEFDYHKSIQGGQYCYYSEEIYTAINDLIDHINSKYNF